MPKFCEITFFMSRTKPEGRQGPPGREEEPTKTCSKKYVNKMFREKFQERIPDPFHELKSSYLLMPWKPLRFTEEIQSSSSSNDNHE